MNLWAPHDPLRQPRVLTQANHVGMLVGHNPDVHLTNNWAEVMATGTAYFDRTNDHQLVKVLRVGEFGHGRRGQVAALKDLLDVHLCNAARRITGVVVVLCVNHQTV